MTLHAQLKTDPRIALAANSLRGTLPKIWSSVFEGGYYVASGPDGDPLQIAMKKGKGRIRTRRGRDGSVIAHTKHVPRLLTQMLLDAGKSEEETNWALASFADLPDDGALEIAPGFRLSKGSVTEEMPGLTGAIADDRVAALMAYEYLALEAGEDVLDEYYEPTRAYIGGADRPALLEIEHRTANKYVPRHYLRIYGTDDPAPEMIVDISLFGWIIYRVRWKRVAYRGPGCVYVEDLESGQSCLAEWARASENRFTVLNP